VRRWWWTASLAAEGALTWVAHADTELLEPAVATAGVSREHPKRRSSSASTNDAPAEVSNRRKPPPPPAGRAVSGIVLALSSIGF